MLLWVAFAVLTTITLLAVLYPLWWARPVETFAAQDIAIYKQQLEEIETERAAGFLAESEIDAARIEVSRRLLAATENTDGNAASTTFKSRSTVSVVVVCAIALFGIAIYPFSSYIRDNAVRWYKLAGMFMQAERYAEAAEAFAKVVKAPDDDLCSGDDLPKCPAIRASVYTKLGVAIAYTHQGRVTPDARQAFERSIALNDQEAGAQFWLGLADEQRGNLNEAATRYRMLLAGDFAETEKAVVRKRLEVVEQTLKGNPPSTAQPSSAQSGTTAHNSSSDEAVIAGAVGKLAERLKKNGSDLTGWLMLMRSYAVLGRKDDAMKALDDARSNFTGNADALEQINALARELGIAP